MIFKMVRKGEYLNGPFRSVVVLSAGDWDDYSFKTSFGVVFWNGNAERIDLGVIKIGYQSQPVGWTIDAIPTDFSELPTGWFSLGQDVEYYRKIHEKLSENEKNYLLGALKDVVYDARIFNCYENERVFSSSLMRGVSVSVVHGQYSRVLKGLVELTDFRFAYRDPGDQRHSEIALDFSVTPSSTPPTNVHVLIGRNGVGKTTLLNNMVSAIVGLPNEPERRGKFYVKDHWNDLIDLSTDYFSSVVSVSFSVFDSFVPPADRTDRSKGVAYFYIGMKKNRSGITSPSPVPPKAESDLHSDFIESFRSCLSQPAKRDRWKKAIFRLESDSNFADMDLGKLLEMDSGAAITEARSLIARMSAGHAIVLLTLTKLVDTVEEKTLVLMDEPESHLHPPLLSAFTRALSELLYDRNGVAIIATHSPVVLQEVPSSCVWKITRIRTQGRSDRPEVETFGENVGVLTREIFGLEVSKSGFHEVLQRAVDDGESFESILNRYNDQLGFEAQAILRALIAAHGAGKRSFGE